MLAKSVNDVSQCDVIVAHNFNVDIKTHNKELVRNRFAVDRSFAMAKTNNFSDAQDTRSFEQTNA